jgi:hypothetical protein
MKLKAKNTGMITYTAENTLSLTVQKKKRKGISQK